jgi:hypothetical protein
MRRTLTVALLAAAACAYDPRFESGKTRCATSGSPCPGGFVCNSDGGVCVLAGDAGSDGPTGDAALTDGPVADAPAPDGPVIDAPVVDAPMVDGGSPEVGADAMADDGSPDLAIDVAGMEAPCAPAPPECEETTGSACRGGEIVTCGHDARGCLVIVASGTKCALSKRCEGHPPNAKCVCNGEPDKCQGVAGSYCESDSQIRQCVLNSDGCLERGGASSCPIGKSCVLPIGTFQAVCAP